MHCDAFVCTRNPSHRTQGLVQRCPECGGILVAYPVGSYDGITRWTFERSLWAYRSCLPIAPDTAPVSLGEGKTPLVDTPQLARDLGVGTVSLKLESSNPTGSFKDRALSVVSTYAVEHGVRVLVGSSSGNALHAQAAYAACAGLRSIALVSDAVPLSRLAQPSACGTRVVRVHGDYSDCHRLARELAVRRSWYNSSTTYENPVNLEGYKTLAYEIWESRPDLPDWIAIPVGAGPLLGGIAIGFSELVRAKRIPASPALLAVQASECAPIGRAFDRRHDVVDAWDGSVTSVARGIADPLRGYAEDGTYTLQWVRRTGGAVVSVDEDGILSGLSRLAHTCGLYVDPAAAAGVAGVRIAVQTGIMDPAASVVAIITGTGFKEVIPGLTTNQLGKVIEPDVDLLSRLLEKEEAW